MYNQKSSKEKIKIAFERNVKALNLKPSIGYKTAVTSVILKEGMKCQIEDGGWVVISDISEKRGGDNTAANPGVLLRGALGSCMVMSYVMWAAKMNIDIKNIQVKIEADFDARGEFGFDVTAGYTDIRIFVDIESNSPEVEIYKLLDTVEENSSVYEVVKNKNEIKRIVKINSLQEAY